MKTIGWVVHGRLKNDRRWAKLNRMIHLDSSFKHKVLFTEFSGHATALTQMHINEKCDFIVGVGGDGTLNECANGIAKQVVSIPLGVIAMGTGNDFVKSIGIKGNWEELRHAMVNDGSIEVDIIRIRFMNRKGESEERFCLNVLDIGIGGEVVQRMAKSKRRLGPFLTYQKAIISTLVQLKRPIVQWQMDNQKFHEKTLMLAIANAKWFGSGLGIAPGADVSNGQMEIIHLGDISILDYFKQLPHLRKGQYLKHPEIRYDQGTHLQVITPELPIDCDGEFIGTTPMDVRIIQGRLKILAP